MAKKKKKRLNKQINPEKSNKMIYAVGGGLVLLMAVFLFFTIRGEKVVDKLDLMEKTLSYLKYTDGVKELKCLPDQDKVIIIREPVTEMNKNMDFPKIARYAGLRLSNKWGETALTVVVYEQGDDNPVYSVVYTDGRFTTEKHLR